jgi:hypothetical protein
MPIKPVPSRQRNTSYQSHNDDDNARQVTTKPAPAALPAKITPCVAEARRWFTSLKAPPVRRMIPPRSLAGSAAN